METCCLPPGQFLFHFNRNRACLLGEHIPIGAERLLFPFPLPPLELGRALPDLKGAPPPPSFFFFF